MAEFRNMNPNDWSRSAWEANAEFWDGRMAEGNEFFRVLVWPAVERLLAVQPGMRILDAACGNGVTTRRLAALGADVLGFDFSTEMVRRAEARGGNDKMTYRVLDATDEAALRTLGEVSFDAALCNMALFDMADIRPLFRALARLLKPGAAFVFSLLHPCFNSGRIIKLIEEEDLGDKIVTTFGVKVYDYLTTAVHAGNAMRGQPMAQPYFHRPLQEILACGFAAGFALDGLEERAFPADSQPASDPLSWGANFSQIPPVMVVRMRSFAKPGRHLPPQEGENG